MFTAKFKGGVYVLNAHSLEGAKRAVHKHWGRNFLTTETVEVHVYERLPNNRKEYHRSVRHYKFGTATRWVDSA